jgi:hypothetical protein
MVGAAFRQRHHDGPFAGDHPGQTSGLGIVGRMNDNRLGSTARTEMTKKRARLEEAGSVETSRGGGKVQKLRVTPTANWRPSES